MSSLILKSLALRDHNTKIINQTAFDHHLTTIIILNHEIIIIDLFVEKITILIEQLTKYSKKSLNQDKRSQKRRHRKS